MSVTSQEFYSQLEDGQRVMSILTTEECYNLIPREVTERFVINEIRQRNESLESDEVFKSLKREYMKSKKKMIDYEYRANNNTSKQ